MKAQFYKLMLITNKSHKPCAEYLQFIGICVKAGVTSVQLREKDLSSAALLNFGAELKKFLSPFAIPLIVNDDVDLAVELDADGVHLGQSDGDLRAARELLGVDKIVGVSIDSIENLRAANELPVDYVGCGTIFPTQNKANVATTWGVFGLQQLSLLSQHPIIAVGGIDASNAKLVVDAGADGIAAIGAFHDADDPEVATKILRSIIVGE